MLVHYWSASMVKVMLVEDDPTMFDLLKTLLIMEGFDVVSSSGPQGILADMRDQAPELVLLDVHLLVSDGSEINGFDVLKQIRSDQTLKDTKVLMSSGVDFSYKSEIEGADGFLLKPYMADDLIDRIKDVVN